MPTIQMNEISEIDISDILQAVFRLRSLNERIVRELMGSINDNGLLQPITVRPEGLAKFRLVFGAHRLEGAKRLGWKRIPAFVKSVSEEESFLMNIAENMQRNAYISPIAEAKGYKHPVSKKWTIREIAQKIGKSDSYVCDRLRLLNTLHLDIQKRIESPRGNSGLSLSHAEHLSLIGDYPRQLELAKLVMKHELSVRQLERLTRKDPTRVTPNGCLCRKCRNYACRLHGNTRAEKSEKKRLLRRFMEEGINKRNFNIFDELCSLDYVYHGEIDPMVRKDVRGLDYFKKLVAEEIAAVPDLKVEVEDIITEGDKVAVRYTEIGTHIKGIYAGLAPTGNHVTWVGVSIYRVQNGKLAEEWLVEKAMRL